MSLLHLQVPTAWHLRGVMHFSFSRFSPGFFPPDRSQQTLHVKEQIAGFAEQEAKSKILIRFLYNNRKKPKFLQNCINEVQNVTVIIEYMYYNADLIRRRN